MVVTVRKLKTPKCWQKAAKLAGGKAYLFCFFVVKKNMKIVCSHLPVKFGDIRSPTEALRVSGVYLFPSWTSTFCGSKTINNNK